MRSMRPVSPRHAASWMAELPTSKPRLMPRAFFETNLGSVEPANTVLTVLLPQNNTGGGTLKLTAGLKYKPYFFGAFAQLMGKGASDVNFSASSEIKLKNTLEVALVLDNSGSMNETGSGSSKVRIDLLKEGGQVNSSTPWLVRPRS